jgi:hypothetical protein
MTTDQVNSRRRRHPSPALIVSAIALVAALAGTSYALPGRNTVDGGDIRNNSVKAADIRDDTVGLAEISSGAEQALGGSGGGGGGPAGISGLERVAETSVSNSNTPKIVTATCPGGKRLLSASYNVEGQFGILVDEVTPNADLTSASVYAYEPGPIAGNWSLTAYAICAS